MSEDIPFEEAAAILGRYEMDEMIARALTPPPPPPMRIPSPKWVGFTPQQLLIPPPIQFGQYFLIKNTTQQAQFKRNLLAQQKEYMDLFARLTIQANAYDERIELIHRTVREMRAAGIPISKTELHTARERLKQYEESKFQVHQQRKFVYDHLEDSKSFMQKISRSRARRRY